MPSRPVAFHPPGYRPAQRKPKATNPHYLTPEHRQWAAKVIEQAGGRCQAMDEATGRRCTRTKPQHRIYADHVVELADGGHPFGQGQALCAIHHEQKTSAARQRRQNPQAWDAMHAVTHT